MTALTYKWDDFSGGDYGTLGPHEAQRTQVSGRNVRLLKDGSICPRPGLKEATITSNVNGVVRGLHYIGLSGKALLIVVGDDVYSTSNDGSFTLTAVTPALDAAATEFCPVAFYDPNGDVYLSSPGDATYVIDWTAGTLAKITVAGADRGGRGIGLIRDRLYIGGDPDTGAAGYRVYYSDAAAFTTIGALNYFDVGYFWDVLAFMDVNNTILMPKRNDGWWGLVGQTPSGTLRKLTADNGVRYDASGKQQSLVRERGKIWYFGPGHRLRVTDGSRFDIDEFAHIELRDKQYGVHLDEVEHTVYVSSTSNVGLIRSWGAWFHQSYGVTLSGPVCGNEFHSRAIMVGSDTVSTPGRYWSLDLDLDRPAFTSDTYARPGDGSDTPLDAYFWLRPEFHEEARMMRVRKVVVEFRKWATGSTVANNITAAVRTFGRRNESGGSQDSYGTETLVSWNEAGTQALTSGPYDRHEFSAGDQAWCSGFQLGFTDLRGVSIARVIAYVDVDGTPSKGTPVR